MLNAIFNQGIKEFVHYFCTSYKFRNCLFGLSSIFLTISFPNTSWGSDLLHWAGDHSKSDLLILGATMALALSIGTGCIPRNPLFEWIIDNGYQFISGFFFLLSGVSVGALIAYKRLNIEGALELFIIASLFSLACYYIMRLISSFR